MFFSPKIITELFQSFFAVTGISCLIADHTFSLLSCFPAESTLRAVPSRAYVEAHPDCCISFRVGAHAFHLLFAPPPDSRASKHDCKTIVQLLCTRLSLLLSESTTAPIDQIHLYILDHLSEEISAEMISDELHIPRSSLFRLIKKYCDCTPGAFVLRCRIHRAKQLLQETDLPVSDVALQCGMMDANYFTYLFRKSCGLPPSRYRRQFGSFAD